jgi:signal transduction histidine kinase
MKVQFYRDISKKLLIMLTFGAISIILGYIQFTIPGMEGGGSDMREIGILLSIIFLPNWVYILGVAFLASLSFPLENLEVSTILMHFTASLFAWFFYKYIKNKTSNLYILGGLWVLMVIAYYIFFLIPTLVIVFWLFKVITGSEILSYYKDVLYSYRFELFTSATVTSLFLVLYRVARILEIRNKELEKALMKSEESDRLKTAFLNNINHEIRTPLNGIIGFTNLLIEPDLNKERRQEYGKMLFSSSNQLLTIISNIIDLSKIKTGQVELRVDYISMNEFLDSINHYYSSVANEKNLLFEIEYSGASSDDFINTDKRCLRQIIDNLLNNAFKFTKKGSVRLSYEKNDDQAIFNIKDTGPGIDPVLHERIFEHFSKIENENESFLPGTGLGLSISKELVKLLGGRIFLKSEIGRGSEFSFTIPSIQQ